MIEWITQFLYKFTAEAEAERYQKEMYNFLSQAEDILHLEVLEKEWDREHRHLYRRW